jgi:hypothetical protein
VIADVITATLRREVETGLGKTDLQGRRKADAALRKQGEVDAAKALPPACPYSFDQIVSHDWFPASRHGLVDEEG